MPALIPLLAALAAAPHATLAEPATVEVYPPSVSLTSAADRQSVVVRATYPDGTTRDVTAEATLSLPEDTPGKKTPATRDGFTLRPAADGETELTVTYGGETVAVPVTVGDHAARPPVSFEQDVMPVFARTGCNMGSCHGAARGKDGFRLSLFGFDPDGDHFRLTRELSGRRVNLAVPERSLVYEKSVGAVSHTGGKRMEPGSEYAQTLLRWLAAGAPQDDGPVPECVKLEVFPPGGVLAGPGAAQRLVVRALYADGTDRDVTTLATFGTSNDVSAEVGDDGRVVAGERGEAFVTARYDVHTVGVPFVVLPAELDYEWSDPPVHNYVDELVDAKLKNLRITPSELCTDAEFLRRVHIDLVGELPPPAAYAEFAAKTGDGKRAELIDELLGRKEFSELWVMKWAELLAIRSDQQTISYKAAVLYFGWLRDQISRNVPVDEMVRSLLSSEGGTFSSPATNYYEMEKDNLKTAENVAQVFMGMRVQCAQCHNHPFDRWTMDDYYAFSAFFSQVGRKNGEDPREKIVFNRGGGEVKHPVDGRRMDPKFLGGEAPDFRKDEKYRGRDRREVLVEWLASPENPYFARNVVNIVWAHFLGRGIVEPVDDVRVSNPPSNEPLLAELAERFTQSGYDFKQLVRDITNSRTYQLSTAANASNAGDVANFSHAPLRRMRAEVLLDVISQVTETQDKFKGLPKGARAVQIADGTTSSYFLTAFGRATRETVCSCEVKVEPNLSQALHLLNGDTVHGKVQSGKVVEQLLKDGKAPADVLADLTVRCVSREPTDAERGVLEEMLAEDGADAKQVLEDLFWALLNSREFVFNH